MIGSSSLKVSEIKSHHVYKRLGVFLYRDGSRRKTGIGGNKGFSEDISNSWTWWLSQYCRIMHINVSDYKNGFWKENNSTNTHIVEKEFFSIFFSFRRHFHMTYYMNSGTKNLWIACIHRSHVWLICEKVWIYKCKIS